MSTEPGFFERRPWAGAAMFFALLVVVGLVLVLTVGERPHYRNSTWQLFTERPAQGQPRAGSGWENDPVRVQVLVRVQAADGTALPGVEASLALMGETESISGGVTGAPGGHVQLPVPARFDEDLFAQRAGVTLFLPGGPVTQSVVPPEKGEWMVHFPLEGRCTTTLHVLERDGSAHSGTLRAFPHADPGMPDPRARGLESTQGTVTIGGCEIARAFAVTVFTQDGRCVTATVRAGDASTHTLTLPAPGECAIGTVTDIEHRPVQLGFVGTIPLDPGGSAVHRQVRSADGSFAIPVPQGRYRVEVVTEGGRTRSAVMTGPQQNLKLQVLPGGAVSGRVTEMRPESIVMLFDPEQNPRQPWMQSVVFPDGTFQIGEVPAGIWDLELRRPNHAHVLVSGLRIEPGTPCADPRLRDIR